MRTVRSSEPDAMCCPSGSGDQATQLTSPLCPVSVRIASPVSASHSRTVSSHEPEQSRLPSGDQATPSTSPVCPLSSRSARPLAASHSRIVLSSEQDASIFPSGDQATPLTVPPCSPRIRICRPVAASHRHTCLSLTTTARKGRAIRRPGNADHSLLVLERPQEPPALQVPEPDGLVIRRRRQDAAVGRQGHPVDVVSMSPQRMAELEGGMGASAGRGAGCCCDSFSSGAILFSPATSI